MTPTDLLLEVLSNGSLFVGSLARKDDENPIVPGTMGMTQAQVYEASRELAAAQMLRCEPGQNHGHRAGAMWSLVV